MTGEIVTAALLNEQVKDNGLLTAPAIMTAQGDLIYGSAANTPARLAKDANSTRSLTNTGTNNNPAWAQVALATGVSGTLPVGNGGTGATSLTANGALIGNGTSAIASVDMSTKGGLLAGDGSGNPSVLAIGGSNDHVLTVDSGETTGMKWAAASPAVAQATQSAVEAETNEDTYIPPDLIKHSPGVAKVWGFISAIGALSSPSYGISSITDVGVGDRTINFSTNFSTAVYSGTCITFEDDVHGPYGTFHTPAVGSVKHIVRSMDSGSGHQKGLVRDSATSIAIYGDQ